MESKDLTTKFSILNKNFSKKTNDSIQAYHLLKNPQKLKSLLD